MEKITIDEKNKKRIQKYLKQAIGMYGYKEDRELIEKNSELTDELAIKVFVEIMNDALNITDVSKIEENNEFKEQIEDKLSRFTTIPKPNEYEERGCYTSDYIGVKLGEIYNYMKIIFDLREAYEMYHQCENLRRLANTVITSINGIEKYKIELPPEVQEELQKIQTELIMLLDNDKTDMQEIQKKIDLYNNYAIDIWNDYLTNVNDTENSNFRWCVHNLSKGDLQGEFRTKYMSTSLITNKAMGLFGEANYGLIVKPKHIISANYKDSFTYNDRENTEDLFDKQPPIMLPQEIEKICIERTIKMSGEMLNYDFPVPVYSEIVVDDYEIQGVYYISNGEHELSQNYEKAQSIAEEKEIPLIEKDISKYREEYGLEPMTIKMRRNFFMNILDRCYNRDEMSPKSYNNEFIDGYYQEFYEMYMKLKKTGNYSKIDIFKTLLEIIRNDSRFGAISQKIEDNIAVEDIQYSKSQNVYGEDKLQDEKLQIIDKQEKNDGEVNILDLWIGRFKVYYNTIKSIKMEKDIVDSIKDKLTERKNKKQKDIQENNKVRGE